MKKIFSNFFFWLAIGLAIRLMVMPFSSHTDMWTHSLGSYIASNFHQYNISDYMRQNPHPLIASNYGSNFFPYPPVALYFFMFRDSLFQPLYQSNYFQFLVGPWGQYLYEPLRYLYLFLWKLPYLFFDLGVAYLITRFFLSQREKIFAFALWMLNPWAIYVSFIFGHYDIVPTFFVLLALLTAQKRPTLSVLVLGLAIAFKTYPLLFLPFFALVLARRWFDFFFYLCLGVFPYLISILPFLSSSFWRQDVLFSYQSQYLLSPSFAAGRGESIFLFPFLWACFFGGVYLKKIKAEALWAICLAVLLLLFSITFYHPQWILWLAPFLVLFLVKNPKQLAPVAFLFFFWVILTALFERSLTTGLFSPLFRSLPEVPSLGELINPFFPTITLKNLVRSLFAVPGLYLTYQIIRNLFWSQEPQQLNLSLS